MQGTPGSLMKGGDITAGLNDAHGLLASRVRPHEKRRDGSALAVGSDKRVHEHRTSNAGHVVSKTMIMERVWDYNFDPGTNVVEARISKLREKVDKNFEIPLIHTVRGLGYVVKRNNV